MILNIQTPTLHKETSVKKSQICHKRKKNNESDGLNCKFIDEKKKAPLKKRRLAKIEMAKSISSSKSQSKAVELECKIKCIGENAESIQDFSHLGLHSHLTSRLSQISISSPTLIQKLSIPYLLKGNDVLVKSDTGTGKTLVYVLSILHKLQAITPPITRTNGVHALIIVPTRELAAQTLSVFNQFSQTFVRLVAGALLGGAGRKSEKRMLRKGVNLLIATPGRMLDHLTHTAALRFPNLRYIVVDEADKLLEMNFEKQIREVYEKIKRTSSRRRIQTVLLSATLTPEVIKLLDMMDEHPYFVDSSTNSVRKIEDKSYLDSYKQEITVPSAISQHYVNVGIKRRLIALYAFILEKLEIHKSSSNKISSKIIVFTGCCSIVDFLCSLIQQALYSSDLMDPPKEPVFFKINGNMDGLERVNQMTAFRKANRAVLFCTDVGSRGLDIPGVDWIIQYEAPPSVSDYVHRIGRTARIGHSGNSLLFLSPHEQDLIPVLKDSKLILTEMSLDHCYDVLIHYVEKTKKSVPRDIIIADFHCHVQSCVDESTNLQDLAKAACKAFVRSYARYPREMKHILNVNSLHLGYVNNSFCVKATPSEILKPNKANLKKKRQEKFSSKLEKVPKLRLPLFESRNVSSREQRPNYTCPWSSTVSEFASGM